MASFVHHNQFDLGPCTCKIHHQLSCSSTSIYVTDHVVMPPANRLYLIGYPPYWFQPAVCPTPTLAHQYVPWPSRECQLSLTPNPRYPHFQQQRPQPRQHQAVLQQSSSMLMSSQTAENDTERSKREVTTTYTNTWVYHTTGFRNLPLVKCYHSTFGLV